MTFVLSPFRLLLIPALSLTACDDVTREYATRDAAVRVDALGRGHFLPEFIPTSARGIIDEHNVDNNHGRFQFTHSSEDSNWPLKAGFAPVATSNAAAPEATFTLDEREGTFEVHYRCEVRAEFSVCKY